MTPHADRPLPPLHRCKSGDVVVGAPDALLGTDALVDDVNWISIDAPEAPIRATVRIRHRHQDAPALIRPLSESRAHVTFDDPQRAITPGQAAVFYDGEVCLGGGWIGEALSPGRTT